jgi:hypothetical protein
MDPDKLKRDIPYFLFPDRYAVFKEKSTRWVQTTNTGNSFPTTTTTTIGTGWHTSGTSWQINMRSYTDYVFEVFNMNEERICHRHHLTESEVKKRIHSLFEDNKVETVEDIYQL